MKVDKKGKYYTPTIEEFHIGFEYEEITGVEGNSLVFEHRIFNNNTSFSDMEFNLKKQKSTIHYSYFVKYLDQEDIESLGFVADKDRHWGYRELYILGNYSIKVMLPSREIIIQTIDKEKEPEYFGEFIIPKLKTIFEGKIKNKSELIKLLKQLGINE